ncbi:hypothetical protein M0657_000138 [Pyricularia oryzae]|uniref:Ilp is an apoptosis inhibitor n=2 Tax=Pyricularia oryzae TaxID=318829 RepID=A0A4P7N4Y6_PYROR|nr:hypothetical protein M9X92_000022 [Pyricularia oryzae]KAI7932829.1 hypothetical protein M0657_000138 [Pyricularia oryzae]QBZ56131.1 hypothetical protein PoMZ_01037 [Pyricularia oryzae]
MDFSHNGGESSSFAHAQGAAFTFWDHQPSPEAHFDFFEWHGHFQSCVRYFLDHAQHSEHVKVVAAFINITLPFQNVNKPIMSSRSGISPTGQQQFPGKPGPGIGSSRGEVDFSFGGFRGTSMPFHSPQQHLPQHQDRTGTPSPAMPYCTLTPYIRRLVAMGLDSEGMLHGFFGDDWKLGVGPFHEVERRNYLFASKSANWLRVKASYDMDGGQYIPYIKPLQNATEAEIKSADNSWSEWLLMQDWMVGPRAPTDMEDIGFGGQPQQRRQSHHHHGQQRDEGGARVHIKREEE